MNYAMQPVRRVTRAIERYDGRTTGFGGWNIAGIAAGLVVAILIAMNAKDVVRYIKISSM